MARLRIGIIFGGMSEEHPVAVKSAQEVAAAFDTARYEPVWIGVTTDGRWKLCDGPVQGWEQSPQSVEIAADRGIHGVRVFDGESDGAASYHTLRLDAVLPVVHGKFAEDGALQGLLELSGIPYVGCDVQSSAICMDKSLAYAIVRSAGIPTPDWHIWRAEGDVDANALSYPVFVKPARSGSSFGVSKVHNQSELPAAIAAARQYDGKVLIEQSIVGKEIGCSILGTEGSLTVGEVDHVALSSGFLHIHQESAPEVESENAQFIVPADIPVESQRHVKEVGKKIFSVLGCRGLARVDMFLTDSGEVLLNEVNTLPGLTSYSRYPRMMAAAGLPLGKVIDSLIDLAIAR